jgi:hypothetical protein
MTREQDVQTVIRAIEATPEALELRARVAASIATRGKADLTDIEHEALRLSTDAAWAVLDAHPEIAYLLAPPAITSLAMFLLRTAAAARIAAWAIQLEVRDRSGEH